MTEMIKAAVLVGPEKLETKSVPVPEMKAGDIRIRVSACGVCGSDILRGRRRSGHESL